MNFIFSHVSNLVKKNELNLEDDEINVVLITDGFKPLKNQKLISEIPPEFIQCAPVKLDKKSFKNNVFDAWDVCFHNVCGSSKITGILIYQEQKGILIAFIASAFGFPVSPNGGDIIVTWDNDTNKIFILPTEDEVDE